MSGKVEIVGIKQSLKTLQDLDKKARRAITSDYRRIVKPVLDHAKSLTPTDAPLSGFDRSWTPSNSSTQVLPFTGSPVSRPPKRWGKHEMQFKGGRRQYVEWMKWKNNEKAFVSGKRPKTVGYYTKNLAAFGIRWQGPAAVLFDSAAKAHTPQGARMINALNNRFGKPSRVMWRAYEAADAQVQAEMEQLVKRIMREANAAIASYKGRGLTYKGPGF